MSSVQRQLYGIGIFEEEIVLTDYTGLTEKRFVISQEQLMSFCRSDVTFRPFPGLIWMKTDGVSETYLVELPAKERVILYRKIAKAPRKGKKPPKDLVEYRMRLPRIVAYVKVDTTNRKIGEILLWGYFGRLMETETALYELPLPNLSGARLCLGSTERADVNVDFMGAVERTLFDTPFNHHNHLVGKKKIPFEDYVTKYKGRCPVNTLNKIGTGSEILGGALWRF